MTANPRVRVTEFGLQAHSTSSLEGLVLIDTHTHFYDPTRPQGVPWPSPKEKALYRPVLPEHYKALAIPEGVTGTVVVEASPWVEDNQWILDLAAKEPFILGYVGNLRLGAEDFRANLERFAANPLFRGLRASGAAIRELVHTGQLDDLETLAAKDLELDLLLGPADLPAVYELAQRIPSLRLVLDHVAGVRIDGRAPDSAWVEGIRQVATCPNVFCKVSGLAEQTGQRPAPTNLDYYLPTLEVLWNAFGEERLIYGSNWPVCEPFASYATVQRLVGEYFGRKGAEASEKYFWKNAQTAYALHRGDAARR